LGLQLIQTTDNKVGSGPKTRPGDIVEMHYQVGLSDEDIDTPAVLQTTWRNGSPIVAQLGSGALRAEIDQALTGVPLGTDRWMRIPSGTWSDIDRDVSLAVYLQRILGPSERFDPDSMSEFAAGAWTVPQAPTTPSARVSMATYLAAALAASKKKRGSGGYGADVIALRLPASEVDGVASLLNSLLISRVIRHQPIRLDDGSGPVELRMARADAEAVQKWLSES